MANKSVMTEEIAPNSCVLLLAGVELIFFRVAGRGLCFGFVLKTVRIIKRKFVVAEQGCTEPRPFLFLGLPHWQGSWGYMGSLGGDAARTADPSW